MCIRSIIIAAVSSIAMLIAGASMQTEATAHTIDYTTQVVYGQSASRSYLTSIKKNLSYSQISEDIRVPVLAKSRTLKKCFVLKENQTLVIPSGKTLTLTGGANIAGKLYIEKGGKLVLKKYQLNLTGSIVCDGKLSITGGTLACFDDSMLFIGESGSFTATDRGVIEQELNGRICCDNGADVVCLGTTNIPDPTFAAEPVAAIHTRIDFGGAVKKVSPVTANINSLLPSVVGYDSSTELGDGDFADCYTVLFSGGSCVKLTANGNISNGWSSIGNVNIQIMQIALDVYRS
ncbi:MAG: hypothetical protein IJZ95_04660 [Oscillospiraceae bacterium]|nr:hypothetical protein [Oscillospiraceae bacterium]